MIQFPGGGFREAFVTDNGRCEEKKLGWSLLSGTGAGKLAVAFWDLIKVSAYGIRIAFSNKVGERQRYSERRGENVSVSMSEIGVNEFGECEEYE